MDVDVPNNITSTVTEDTSDPPWRMSKELFVFSMALLSSELLVSALANSTLMAVILHSPNLKSPPNYHLVNICMTNLLLTFGMMVSAASVVASGHFPDSTFVKVTGHMQFFITVACFLQYWCVFSAIGHYRYRTIRRLCMSLPQRRRLIRLSISLGWLFSLGFAGALTGSFNSTTSTITWNAFRRIIDFDEEMGLFPLTIIQYVFLILLVMFVLMFLIIILRSYYFILKTLGRTRPIGRNKVGPCARHGSLVSESGRSSSLDLRPYHPRNNHWTAPFVVNDGKCFDKVTVHYEKRTQSITLDDMFTFGYPGKLQKNIHSPLKLTLSNSSNVSTQSGKFQGFSDISPAAELQRLQMMKNTCALQNQSWRQDSVTLRSATKNSIVMMCLFVVSFVPLFVCSVPSLLPPTSIGGVNNTLLFCHLLYYLFAPTCPVWYLICSARVRKCLLRLIEHALIRLNIRQ